MKMLAIDTATERCSVALEQDGVVLERQLDAPGGHAEHVLGMIDELLRQGGLALPTLDAIAFGRGPGSFTGVRLAASIVQGLAFGAGLPVVPVSDLLAIAQQAFDADARLERALVCHDARMGEVYWCACERGADALARAVGAEQVSAPESVVAPGAWGTRGFAALGTALARYPLLQRLGEADPGAPLLPRAREILKLARADFAAGRRVAAQEALPVYLRDEVAKRPQGPKTVS